MSAVLLFAQSWRSWHTSIMQQAAVSRASSLAFPSVRGCDTVSARREAPTLSPNNKQIVRKLFKEFLDKGNLAVADEIIALHHVHHDPATPQSDKGPDGQKKVITLYRNAFSDLH